MRPNLYKIKIGEQEWKYKKEKRIRKCDGKVGSNEEIKRQRWMRKVGGSIILGVD